MVTDKIYDVDLFLGIGGGPEGVLAASALDAYDCYFQGKFIFENDEEKLRARQMGIKILQKNMIWMKSFLETQYFVLPV